MFYFPVLEIRRTDVTAVKLFFDGMAGKWPFLFWFQYLGGSTAAELFSVLEMWWLGFWAKQYALRDAGDVQVSL